MGRLLFWILVILAGVLAWRWMTRQSAAPGRRPADDPAAEPMVACARCGVHLPRSAALERQGLLYCGEEHARLGAPPSSS